jgi:hypothetical protein
VVHEVPVHLRQPRSLVYSCLVPEKPPLPPVGSEKRQTVNCSRKMRLGEAVWGSFSMMYFVTSGGYPDTLAPYRAPCQWNILARSIT